MNEDLQNCIEKLKVYAERAVFNKDDLEKLEERITQLQVTRESILEYEKKGVPVPKGVRDEEEKLVAEIDKLTGGSEFGEVYKALLPIAVRLGRVCQRPLQKDLRETIIKDNKDITPPRVFRGLVIQFLKESGGSASLSDVMHQIEQSLQGHFTGPDRDLLPGKKRCRSQDNVLREIRQMKRERILTRRGGSTLILASHDREVTEGKQQGSQRLRWKRASCRDDCFDLELTNPEALDVDRCRQLLEAVTTEDGIRPPYFNKDASKEFHRWLSNLDTPLQEQAYARLSNWFLTDKEFCRNSPLGQSALELWNTLFCAKPDIRLTNPKKDYKILRERFDLWWPSQLDCQKKGRASIRPEGESADYYNRFIPLWEGGDFTIAPGNKGYSAKHKGNPRLWVFENRLQIAPNWCNRLYGKLFEVLQKHFPRINAKPSLKFDLPELSWEKFTAFVAEVKAICNEEDC